MTDIKLPANDWKPRDYQLGLWNARFVDKKDRACVVWHRRAGKDLTSLNMLIIEAMQRVGIYWHVFPTYAQGKKAIWRGVDSSGRSFLSYIPEELRVRQRDDEMWIELPNGSMYQVIGGDKIDRIVGPNPVGIIFSEYSLMNPTGWNLIRPILRENKGWANFIYTPRGYNHGWKMFQAAQDNPDKWFSEVLDITMTKRPNGEPVITEADMQEDIDEGMPEELARQEYLCDWSAPLVGAYYGHELDRADREGRVADYPHRAEYPVYTCWDLGITDSMVIWFFQIVDGWVQWIDYYASHGAGLEHYAEMLQSRAHDCKYVYKDHYAPHDIKAKEIGTGVTRLETAWNLGIKFSIAPFLNVDDGINAVRMLLKRSKFDKARCDEGLIALRHYRKEWSEKTHTWGAKPVHDWASHPADAMRTGAVCIPSQKVKAAEAPRYQDTVDDMIKRINRAASDAAMRTDRI